MNQKTSQDCDILAHWTSNTHHVHRSRRSEVGETATNTLAMPTAEVLAGKGPSRVPSFPDYVFDRIAEENPGTNAATTMVVKHNTGPCLLQFTIGEGEADSGAWFQAWSNEANYPPCPKTPWCVTRLDNKGMSALPITFVGAMGWAAGFCRCVAWAVLDTLHSARH